MTTNTFLSTPLIIVDCLVVHQATLERDSGLMITDDLASLWSISCRYITNLGIKTACDLPLVEDLS